MTEINLTSLMQAIDEAGDRLDAAKQVRDKANGVVHDIEIEHAALMRALALAQPAAATSPAPAPKPVTEKPPRTRESHKLAVDQCVTIMSEYRIDPKDLSDRDLKALLKQKGYTYPPGVVRDALTLIGQQSRAASSVAEPVPPTDALATPTDDSGAGASSGGSFPDTPVFLRRAATPKPEAAE